MAQDSERDERGRDNRSSDRNRGRSGGSNYRGRRGRYQSRRRVCLYCADKEKVIDWKDHDQLRRFIGDNGEIYPRRKSGLCAKHQRGIAVAVKRARQIALLPYTGEHNRIMGRN